MSINIASPEFWDRRADVWNRRATAQAALEDVYGLPPLTRLNLQPGERVLDLGCGPGVTALVIADLVGPEGEVVGVDFAPGMVEAAQARAEAAGATNVSFVVADVQSDPLGTGFDAAYSRFGVMFFDNPAAAFNRIGSALHPGGRFAAAVWGPAEANPWATLPTIATAQTLGVDVQFPSPDEPGPFSLADPEIVEKLLTGAGFNTITNEEIAAARVIGTDTADTDVRPLVEVGRLSEEFLAADAAMQQRVIDALLDALAGYKTDTGWEIPGLARCVTAIRG